MRRYVSKNRPPPPLPLQKKKTRKNKILNLTCVQNGKEWVFEMRFKAGILFKIRHLPKNFGNFSNSTKIFKTICKSGAKRESKEVHHSWPCTGIRWRAETYQNPVVLGCSMSNGHHCWKHSAEGKTRARVQKVSSVQTKVEAIVTRSPSLLFAFCVTV